MHNYLPKILWLNETGIISKPEYYDVGIAHDDWCSIHDGKECNCNPDIYVNGKYVDTPRSEASKRNPTK